MAIINIEDAQREAKIAKKGVTGCVRSPMIFN